MRTIVVGVGNPARGDDGVGLAVAREVRARLSGDPSVAVEELWAGGLRLAETLAGHDRAVVVDAMETGAHRPGHVTRLTLAEADSTRSVNCVHDTTLAGALAFLSGAGEPVPSRLALIGVEVGETSVLREELSPEVAGAVGRAADAVMMTLEGWR